MRPHRTRFSAAYGRPRQTAGELEINGKGGSLAAADCASNSEPPLLSPNRAKADLSPRNFSQVLGAKADREALAAWYTLMGGGDCSRCRERRPHNPRIGLAAKEGARLLRRRHCSALGLCLSRDTVRTHLAAYDDLDAARFVRPPGRPLSLEHATDIVPPRPFGRRQVGPRALPTSADIDACRTHCERARARPKLNLHACHA